MRKLIYFFMLVILLTGCETNKTDEMTSNTLMEAITQPPVLTMETTTVTSSEITTIFHTDTEDITQVNLAQDMTVSSEPHTAASPAKNPSADIVENAPNVSYNKTKSWYFNRNKNHKPPSAQSEIALNSYDAYYLGDTSSNVIYLTFDEGYEMGYTAQILDVLNEKDVKAAFFVTKPYIKQSPDLILRMVDEGHIVANHTANHPSMPDKSNDQLLEEITEVEKAFFEVTGQEMPKFIRPPKGEYSVRTLEFTKSIGYKTIFWSYAYVDWITDDQPSNEKALQMLYDNYHNGSIILLHAVSKTNADTMGDFIDFYHDMGYDFLTLYDL